MGVLTANINYSAVGPVVTVPLKSDVTDIYYRGACVFILGDGDCTPVGVATSRFVGISPKYQSVAAGDEISVVVWGHLWLPLGTNIANNDDEGDHLVFDDAGITDNIADTQSADPEGDVGLDEDDAFVGRILRVFGIPLTEN